MSAGETLYESMRANFADLGLPVWSELTDGLRYLWDHGPSVGEGDAVLYPGTATLAWFHAQESQP